MTESWRDLFTDGEIITIKGIGFMLVKKTKRGLAFRKVTVKKAVKIEN
jgi:hypothetical protein